MLYVLRFLVAHLSRYHFKQTNYNWHLTVTFRSLTRYKYFLSWSFIYLFFSLCDLLERRSSLFSRFFCLFVCLGFFCFCFFCFVFLFLSLGLVFWSGFGVLFEYQNSREHCASHSSGWILVWACAIWYYCQIIIIIIIIIIIYSLSVFHIRVSFWISLDFEWQQVSSSLQDWSQDSGRSQQCCHFDSPLPSKSSRPFNNPLVIVPKAPITIGTIVTFMFHSFFNSQARSRYLSFFSPSFRFILWSAGTAKSTILQILIFFFFFCGWLL